MCCGGCNTKIGPKLFAGRQWFARPYDSIVDLLAKSCGNPLVWALGVGGHLFSGKYSEFPSAGAVPLVLL